MICDEEFQKGTNIIQCGIEGITLSLFTLSYICKCIVNHNRGVFQCYRWYTLSLQGHPPPPPHHQSYNNIYTVRHCTWYMYVCVASYHERETLTTSTSYHSLPQATASTHVHTYRRSTPIGQRIRTIPSYRRQITHYTDTFSYKTTGVSKQPPSNCQDKRFQHFLSLHERVRSLYGTA